MRCHADQTARIGTGSGRGHRPRAPPFRLVHQPGTRRRPLPGAHLALVGRPRPRRRVEPSLQRRLAGRHHPRPLRQGSRQVPRPAAGIPPVLEPWDRPEVGRVARLRLDAARRHAAGGPEADRPGAPRRCPVAAGRGASRRRLARGTATGPGRAAHGPRRPARGPDPRRAGTRHRQHPRPCPAAAEPGLPANAERGGQPGTPDHAVRGGVRRQPGARLDAETHPPHRAALPRRRRSRRHRAAPPVLQRGHLRSRCGTHRRPLLREHVAKVRHRDAGSLPRTDGTRLSVPPRPDRADLRAHHGERRLPGHT